MTIQEVFNLIDKGIIYTAYAEKNDMTFILERNGDNAPELLGYYFGEPDDCVTFEVCDRYYNKKEA